MTQRKTRIVSGVAAHLYSQAITVVIQLASLPIFLTRWSTETYGQWLMISAIPAYLSIADAGILTAAGNMMAMHRAREEIAELNRVFACGLLAMILLVPGLALLSGAVLAMVPFGLSVDQRQALFLLSLAALLTLACGLIEAAYLPFGKYPRATFFLSTARIIEWVGTIVGVLVTGSFTGAAAGYCLGRGASLAVMVIAARRDVPELSWSVSGIEAGVFRRVAKSGLGFLSLSVGSGLSIQGMVVIVGARLGGAPLALFSASRTLTRLLAQLAIITAKSMSPEISALYGAGRLEEVRRLNTRIAWTVVPITIVGALLLALAAPTIIAHWSRGKIAFDAPVFALLLAAAVATALWQLLAVRLTATNRHAYLANLLLAVAIAALTAVFFAARTFGLASAAGASLGIEIIMVAGTLWALRRVADPASTNPRFVGSRRVSAPENR